MWDAPFVEFYYPALSDETHVTVDINNAAERFSALRNDQQRQQKLLANAERVSQELLCPSCLESYWRKLILGNKSDAPGRAVSTDEARQKSEELCVPFLETSAKASTNVEEAFLTLASELLRRAPPEKPQKKRLSLAASAKEKGKKCCS